MSCPGTRTIVSCSPATTCAAVTTRFAAGDPAASLDADAARRTEHLDDARRVLPHRLIPDDALAGRQRRGSRAGDRDERVDALQQVEECARRQSRSSCLTIFELSTSWRKPVSPGVRSATEAPTQTRAIPSAPPSRSPPAESISRNGANRMPPRTNEPATSAANLKQHGAEHRADEGHEAASTGVRPAVQQVRREAGADVGADREPGERERAERRDRDGTRRPLQGARSRSRSSRRR